MRTLGMPSDFDAAPPLENAKGPPLLVTRPPRVFQPDELGALGVERVQCRTVLIVDDLAPNLDVLEAVLDDEYEVVRAASGPDAMEALRARADVDLIITDQRMPGQTGIEFLQEAAGTHPNVARMVVTAYSDIPPILAAIQLGSVRRFLLKPWKPAEMLTAVRECLEWKEDRETLARVAAALQEHIDALEAALREQRRTLEQVAVAERTALIGRMTAGITHDLRNQLAVLQLLVERLMDETRDTEIDRLGQDALLSLRALLALVRDVHSFARRQPLQLSLVDFPAEDLIRDTLGLARLEDASLAARVQTSIEPAGLTLAGDAQRLQQALLALLRNAAQASDERAPIHLTIRRDDAQSVCLEVADSGVGMDDATRSRALEPLWSGFGDGHAGLGLSIANMVANAHGGEIRFVDAPRGIVVRLTLRTQERE